MDLEVEKLTKHFLAVGKCLRPCISSLSTIRIQISIQAVVTMFLVKHNQGVVVSQ